MLQENLDMIIVFGAVAIALVLGFVVVPWLKKRGLVDSGDIEVTAKLLQIIQMILNETKFKNEKVKDDIATVVGVTQISVGYVQDMMGDKTIEEQRKAAMFASIAALNKLGIEVDDARKETIELAIELVIR